MPTSISIARRKVPPKVIEDYIRHLRKRRVGDIYAYELERQRLHNAIFEAAGFKNEHPDLGFIPARKIAAMVVVGTIKDPILEQFNNALDDLLNLALACPYCGSGLNRDMKCLDCKKFVSVEENIKSLHNLITKR